jgi:hypothetical protein
MCVSDTNEIINYTNPIKHILACPMPFNSWRLSRLQCDNLMDLSYTDGIILKRITCRCRCKTVSCFYVSVYHIAISFIQTKHKLFNRTTYLSSVKCNISRLYSLAVYLFELLTATFSKCIPF